ncbi:hypothetical protein [Paenibacillus sp. Z3-2]
MLRQVDIQSSHLGRRSKLDYGVCGDVKATIEALHTYGALEMKAAGFLESGTELVNPNLAMVAQAMGMEGIRGGSLI